MRVIREDYTLQRFGELMVREARVHRRTKVGRDGRRAFYVLPDFLGFITVTVDGEPIAGNETAAVKELFARLVVMAPELIVETDTAGALAHAKARTKNNDMYYVLYNVHRPNMNSGIKRTLLARLMPELDWPTVSVSANNVTRKGELIDETDYTNA